MVVVNDDAPSQDVLLRRRAQVDVVHRRRHRRRRRDVLQPRPRLNDDDDAHAALLESRRDGDRRRPAHHDDAMALGESAGLPRIARHGVAPPEHPDGVQDHLQPDPVVFHSHDGLARRRCRQQRREPPRRLHEAPRSDLQERPPERAAVHGQVEGGGGPAQYGERGRGGTPDAPARGDDRLRVGSVRERRRRDEAEGRRSGRGGWECVGHDEEACGMLRSVGRERECRRGHLHWDCVWSLRR
mmetsp:Transcript_22196/g.47742  ORF Transcript_22196/g.47742 Transcript_22196/m.47742 type:complete len:242 (+) Transcript_22196:179-904(+)